MVEGIRKPPTMPTTIPNKVQPPTQRNDGKVRRNNRQLLALARITKTIWRHKYAWPFMEPVDAVALNIPLYYSVITNPMDLGTIKKRLENNYYDSAEECLQDYRLMFQNCYTFNKPETDVYIMAQTLESLLEEKLKIVPPSDQGEPFHYEFRQVALSRQIGPSEDSYESETSSLGSQKKFKSKSKKRRHSSSSNESDFSSTSYSKKKNTKFNFLKETPSDGQKENKPENIMQRKEEERVKQISECFKMFEKVYLKKNKPWPFSSPPVPLVSAKEEADSTLTIDQVKRKLKKGEYDNIYKFCNDMITGFKNEKKYIFPWKNPLRMAEFFALYLRKNSFRYKLSFKGIPNKAVAKKDSTVILSENNAIHIEAKEKITTPCSHEGKNNGPAYTPINNTLSQTNPLKKRGRPKKIPAPIPEPGPPASTESVDRSVHRPMTEEEADILNEQLCTIGHSGVNQILEFIRGTMPELLISRSGDFEVDFENAPPKIQWQIKSKIEEILAKNKVSSQPTLNDKVQVELASSPMSPQPNKNDLPHSQPVISSPKCQKATSERANSHDESKPTLPEPPSCIESADIIDVVSNSPEPTLIRPKNDPLINQQTEKWLSSMEVDSPSLRPFKGKPDVSRPNDGPAKLNPSIKPPKETPSKDSSSEPEPRLNDSFHKDKSKMDFKNDKIPLDPDKILHINEALIPKKPLHNSSITKPIFYPVISPSEAAKERLKQLSRQHRQNYAKQHAVNLCVNQETQHYFDMLVGNYSR